MNRPRIALFVLICLTAVSVLAGTSHLPATNTRKAIVNYVNDAAKVIRKNGPDCKVFSSKAWQGGQYYIFVVGPDDKLICHMKADMVGKTQAEIVNGHGEKVGEKIVAAARTNKGWVDYMWTRPGEKEETTKSTYARLVKGPDGKEYVVGSGAWGLK